MKILYYTHTYFLDSDLPLIEMLVNYGMEIKLVIDLPYYQLKSTMVNISMQKSSTSLINVSEYQELEFITHYISKDNVVVLNRTGKVYSLDNIKMRYNFSMFVKKFNPDIIHCTDFIDLSDFFLYRYRNKMLQVVHDPFPHTGERTLKKRILRNLEYKMVKNYVLLNSKQEKKFVESNKLDKACIYQAALGIFSWLKEFKNDINIAECDNYILFYGRISPYKGVEYLVRAMELIHSDYPDVKLVIAGGGTLYFKELLYDKPYIKVINKYLTMEEVYSLIANCKFVVCPYVDATQSGVVMSSFALHKVVLGTDVGGLPEMLSYGKLGPIVPPKDFNALASKINKLLSDEEELHKYENRVKEASVIGSFSWQKIAMQYIKIYNKIKDDSII